MKANYLFILLFIFPAFITEIFAQGKQAESTEMNMRDLYAFETAAEMYAVADTLPYSAKVEVIIKEISTYINNGRSIENEQVWTRLQKLEPYRMNPKVREAAKSWVDKAIKNISESKQKYIPASMKSLHTISNLYKERNFEQTVKECLSVLKGDPIHPDVRSNLGLALIHLNKDLCAQIELEISTQLYESHAPGLINLSVVYERMNRKEDAELISNKLNMLLFDNEIDNQLIRYNAAWFKNRNGNYTAAEYLLDHPTPLKNTGVNKYDSLRVLNIKQYEQDLNKQ